MSIKITQNKNKYAYLNEVYAISTNLKTIRITPRQKIVPYIRNQIEQFSKFFLFLLFPITLIFVTGISAFDWFILGIAIIVMLLYIIRIINEYKAIKDLVKEETDSTLTINKNKVVLKNNLKGVTVELNWEDIKYILLTNNCITFLSNDNYSIFIPVDYKKECLELIEKYNKKELICENTSSKSDYPIDSDMNILYILTLISLPISIGLTFLLQHIDTSNPVCTTWVFYCFIPISLLSFVLGLVFDKKNKKKKFQKNVWTGILITIILANLGSNFIIPKDMNWSKEEFIDIVQLDVPNKALRKSTYILHDEYDNKQWDYVVDIFDFTKKDEITLNDQIKKSNLWIKGSDLDLDYKINRPFKLKINKSTYVLNYDFSNETYNTFSKDIGDYFIATYDTSTGHMEVHQYSIQEKGKNKVERNFKITNTF